jgi:hypothetical protein
MTVYVDDMHLTELGSYGRMKMCHMIADSDEELHAMADKIDVARKWHQKPPKASSSHYDICMSKRALAIQAGAIEITLRQAAMMCRNRRRSGVLGPPPIIDVLKGCPCVVIDSVERAE